LSMDEKMKMAGDANIFFHLSGHGQSSAS